MSALKDRYINPLKDFGFKKLFGSEPNKLLLIDFLNQILPPKHQIQDLTYSRNEQLGVSELDSLKYYRDLKNVVDTSKEEGIREGIEKGIEKRNIEIARQLKNLGVDIQIIIKSTGLTEEEINNL